MLGLNEKCEERTTLKTVVFFHTVGVGSHKGRILGYAHTNEFWAFSVFLDQVFPFLVGERRILKGSHFFEYLLLV